MEKLTIIINGKGGTGKDTLCQMAANHFKVLNVSSIDPIKEIASHNGWDGEKDDRSRKFLSDLKKAFVEYNDLPQNYLLCKYEDFIYGEHCNDEIMFVHIREPEEIEKFKSEVTTPCLTLLVKGREQSSFYGNASDDGVEGYEYDLYYENVDTLEEAEEEFVRMLKNLYENL